MDKKLIFVLLCQMCVQTAMADEVVLGESEGVPATRLGDIQITDMAKPVQERTELGRLTEYSPMSGSVVDRDEIDKLQFVDSLRELTNRIPGISLIRNMRIPDGGKNYTDNRVDGLRVSYNQTFSLIDQQNITNIDRLEFITGPGSALNSSYAFAGTMNVITRDPPKDFSAKLSQEVGSYGLTRTQGTVGTTTENGVLGFFLAGSTMNDNGWRDNGVAGERKDGLSGKIVLKPTDSTKISLGLDRVYFDFHLAGFIPTSQFNADWRQSLPKGYGETVSNYFTPSLHVQQEIGEHDELDFAISRRSNHQSGYGSGGSGGAWQAICDTVATCQALNGSKAITNTILVTREDDTSMQLWYRKGFDLAKTNLYVGVEQMNMLLDTSTYNNRYSAVQALAGAWGLGTQASAGNIGREKDMTPFVEAEFSPVNRLRFSVGERFDHIEYSVDDRTSANRDGQMTFDKAVFKSGVTFDLTPNHLVWGNLSQGFVAPAIGALTGSGAKTVGSSYTPANYNLLPEESWTQEIGLRGTFPAQHLHYDVGIYHTKDNNFIANRTCTAAEKTALGATAVAQCSINENVGALTADGLESVITWAANNWLDVGLTYTNAEAYYSDYVNKIVNYTGKSYQAMPRQRMNLRLDFHPAPGWNVELEGDHIAKYYLDVTNTSTYSRPDLFNLRASYTKKDWNFWAQILNLTNEKYADRVAITTIKGVSQVGYGTVGNSGTYMPLTLRAGIAYNW